jgi:hypothetical protein
VQDGCVCREFDRAVEDHRGDPAKVSDQRKDGEAAESIAAATKPRVLVRLVLLAGFRGIILMMMLMVPGRDRPLCLRRVKASMHTPDEREREQHDKAPDEN